MNPATLLNIFLLASNAEFPVPQDAFILDGWGVPVKMEIANEKAGVSALPAGHYTVVPKSEGGLPEGARPMFAVVNSPRALDVSPDSPFAVMTHYAQTWGTGSIPVFAAAGLKMVRDEMHWQAVELERGVYHMPDQFTNYMAELDKHGMDLLLCLAFGNKHYDPVPGIPLWASAPYTQDGFEGYANYAKYVLTHWEGRIKHVEIWNEYNGGFARGPANGNPAVYREMLKHAYNAVKSVDPDIQVYAGGTVGVPIDWLEVVFQDGGIDYCDGVSVHPYGYTTPPEGVASCIQNLHALIRKYNNGETKPIWVTEQGWYLTTTAHELNKNNREPITEATQARYLARSWVVFLANGVERIFWYVGRNDQTFPTMGLIASDKDERGMYAPKPAYVAYANLTAQLDGFTFDAKEECAVADVYRFKKGDDELRVIWDADNKGKVISFAATKPVTVTDLYGTSHELHPLNSRVHILATDSPMYLRGKVDGLPQVPAYWPSEVPTMRKIARGSLLPLPIAIQEPPYHIDAPEPFLDPEAFEQFRPFAVRTAREGHALLVGTPRAIVVEPVLIDRFPRVVDAQRMDIIIENNTTEAVTVAEISYNDGVNAITVPQRSRIAPIASGQSRPHRIQLDTPLTPFELRDVKMTATLADGQTIEAQGRVAWCPVLPRTPDLKRGIAAFDGLPKLSVDDWEYQYLEADWEGPEDCGGYFQFCWDKDFIYFCASITDDVHYQLDSGNNTWRGDNLQLGIAPSMPWLDGEWTGLQRREFGVTLAPSGPEIYEGGRHVPGAIVNIARDEESKRTDYVFAMPWAAIGLDSARDFSMGLYVNDNDGKGRKGFKHWSSMKDIGEFQAFRLQR